MTRSDSGGDQLCNYSNNHRGRSTSQKNGKRELDLVVREAGGGAAGAPGAPGVIGGPAALQSRRALTSPV